MHMNAQEPLFSCCRSKDKKSIGCKFLSLFSQTVLCDLFAHFTAQITAPANLQGFLAVLVAAEKMWKPLLHLCYRVIIV